MPPKRSKGVTFKLVHQSYDDGENEGGHGVVMVEEKVIRQHLPTPASSVNRPRRQARDDEDFYGGNKLPGGVEHWAREWDLTPTSSEKAIGRLAGEEEYMNRRNFLRAQDPDDDSGECKSKSGGGDDGVSSGGNRRKPRTESSRDGCEGDDDDDDLLFDDQEEGEVTDEFLRELIFGGADVEADEGLDEALGKVCSVEGEADGDASPCFVPHDTTRRAVDRQFTQLMREFVADERINDADTDDPRSQGALDAAQYFRAMEEFVIERAGIDYTTAEPRCNKGLIHQLKSLACGAPTDMTASGEVMTTTLLPDKKLRFATEFKRETEEIRRAALERMRRRQLEARTKGEDGDVAVKGSENGEPTTGGGSGEEAASVADSDPNSDDETYVVQRVVDKANRLDCETVVSTYSTYFNQPNVIRAPELRRKRKSGKAAGSQRVDGEEDEERYTTTNLTVALLSLAKGKGETVEEKKLRKQLAKDLKRERRANKKKLREVYKAVETEETRRAKESQMAKKTLSFL
uniref:Uncharacterized protein TCIL3000_3_2580 n=1 Tax=Trypanosoma congolense (strain IL3000) TaxID=1068625 RepID=G0UKC0_TRYCI|nr:unnamed protein product [Trypanosoma congolense IL3000]